MDNLSERLRAARLPERTVAICLRGDLVAEFEDLERRYAEATQRPATSLADGGEGAEIAGRMEAIRQEMQSEMLTLRLRALPRRRWSELIVEHPARRDESGKLNEEDEAFGYNAATFFEALIRESAVDPQLTDENWADLDAVLTDSGFNQLANAAVILNRRGVDIPFSFAASRALTGSEPE